MTTPTTYNSASKGSLKITEMNTVHLQNAVKKTRANNGDAALLSALETELNTRTDRTDVVSEATPA